MSRDTDNSFFIYSPLTAKYAGLYQQLFGGMVSFEKLGNRIIREIKAAHAFRRIDRVRELSRILINIPIKECQLIAQYYLVWSQYREAKYDIEALERIIDQTQVYKTKALFSRGAVEWYKGNSEAALSFYTEAMKTSPSVSDYIVLSRSIAVLKSTEGFHESALKDLENLLPIIRHSEPLVYFDVLNSYAVELGAVGRNEEAKNVSSIVLASPFIHAYPEWQETARELKEPSRSSVAFEPTRNLHHNVVYMPLVEHGKSEQVRYNQPARVVNLQRWKTKMSKGKKRDDEKPPEALDTRQMILGIVSFFTDENTTNEQRYKIWEAVEKIMSQPVPTGPEDGEGA
jgi:tetratricopeptide (TPR) repeat protein